MFIFLILYHSQLVLCCLPWQKLYMFSRLESTVGAFLSYSSRDLVPDIHQNHGHLSLYILRHAHKTAIL